MWRSAARELVPCRARASLLCLGELVLGGVELGVELSALVGLAPLGCGRLVALGPSEGCGVEPSPSANASNPVAASGIFSSVPVRIASATSASASAVVSARSHVVLIVAGARHQRRELVAPLAVEGAQLRLAASSRAAETWAVRSSFARSR